MHVPLEIRRPFGLAVFVGSDARKHYKACTPQSGNCVNDRYEDLGSSLA